MSAPSTEDQLSFIYDGVTVTTLGQIFGLDHKDVNKRLNGRVQPVPTKDKYIRYRIRDAAPFLCEMRVDPEEMLKSLSPSKLPPGLQDAFWKAQLSRQKYQKERGELWSTARVFDVVSGAFKVLRLTIMMFVDTVEQRTQLSAEQRRIVQELGDGLLASLETAVEEHFKDYKPTDDEHGTPLTRDALVGDDDRDLQELASRTELAYRAREVAEVDPFD